MDKLSVVIIGMFLLLMSVEDVKSRQIKVRHFTLLLPIALGCCVLNYRIGLIDKTDILVSLVVVGVVGLFSLLSKGMGRADVLLLFILGMVFGGEILVFGMLISFGLIYCAAMMLLVRKKLKRTTTFPYIPFLSVGMLLAVTKTLV